MQHKTSPITEMDQVFGALADSTRRDLLSRLRERECTVGDLAAPQAMSLPAVSKHLRILEKAGLLERRIQGRTHFLRFNPGPLHGAVDWIERQRRFWEGSLERLARSVEASQATAPNPTQARMDATFHPPVTKNQPVRNTKKKRSRK